MLPLYLVVQPIIQRKALLYAFKRCAQYYAKMLKVKGRKLRFLQEEMRIEVLFMLLHF